MESSNQNGLWFRILLKSIGELVLNRMTDLTVSRCLSQPRISFEATQSFNRVFAQKHSHSSCHLLQSTTHKTFRVFRGRKESTCEQQIHAAPKKSPLY